MKVYYKGDKIRNLFVGCGVGVDLNVLLDDFQHYRRH